MYTALTKLRGLYVAVFCCYWLKNFAIAEGGDVDPMAIFYTDGVRAAKLGYKPLDSPYPTDNAIRCLVLGNSSLLAGVDQRSVQFVEGSELTLLFDVCKTLLTAGSSQRRHKRFIIPGTRWCGLGNVASGYTDLGSNAATDRCCRAHDHCPDYISPFSTKNGITNWSILYRFNCDCEDRFYECLRAVTDESSASLVGRLYFNLLQPKCFKIDHPMKCGQKGWWFTCRRRVLDTTKPQEWNLYRYWRRF